MAFSGKVSQGESDDGVQFGGTEFLTFGIATAPPHRLQEKLHGPTFPTADRFVQGMLSLVQHGLSGVFEDLLQGVGMIVDVLLDGRTVDAEGSRYRTDIPSESS